jgi:adhesin/invasin
MRRRVFTLGPNLVVLVMAVFLVMGLAVPTFAVAAKRRPHAILQVELNGTPVRAYSLAALKALTPFAGYAGFRKSTGTIIGPDAITGARVTDIVANALRRPLTADESVEVASVPPFSPSSKTFSYDRLVNLTGFTMYDATSNTPVAMSSLTGPLAAVLVYSDPAQRVMPPANGPLRFMVADATSENVVMSPGSDSVYQVNHINVIDSGFVGRIALNAGDGQSATVGTAVSTPPSVIVRDAHGRPVAGVSVTFAVALGGGSVTGSAATTNAAGIATVGSWTLGATAGANTLTASGDDLSGSPVTFMATGTAGPATQIALNAGDGQSAAAGTAVSTPPSVVVEDANDNPVPGVSVTFAVASGGGSVTDPSATTDDAGIASVGSWTLGTTAGANTLTATSDGLSGSPVTFSATGTAGPAAQIALNAGDGQSASAGTAVSTPPSVVVEDANDNPVSGVSVTFAVASGGGSVSGSWAITDVAGIASVGSWTLGATAGSNTLTATSGTLSGSPVTFSASGSAGVLQVQYNGQPVRAYSLTELQALTPFAGSAGFRKSTGTIVGPDAITGAKVSDIVADALGTPLTATESVNVASVPPNSSYNRTFSYDRLVNFTGFTMYDATSNTPVAISGLTGPLAAVLVYSDPAQKVMPPASGPLRFLIADATSENVVMSPSSDSVSNTNQLNVIEPGPATQMALNAGNNQTVTAGATVGVAPSVIVKDTHGYPVPGASVTFAVASGGGSATGLAATTNAAGIASVGSWTLGTTAGSNTLTATSDGLSGSPVTFSATGTAGPAAQIALNVGDSQTASAGTAVSTPPSVIVSDTNNNPVSGVSVTFAVASGGGSASGLSATSDAAGIASVGSWTLGATVGSNTLTATSGTLSGSPVTFTVTGTAGVLQVQYNGTPVRAYSLSELEAVTPFSGYAGFRKITGTIVGPDAITGARVTDIVADALGTPLTTTESVDVAQASPYYGKTFSYDRLVNFTDFTMYDATTKNPVAMSSLTGPLAAVLIYSDPAQKVMPTASGPLRLIVADATSENVVMSPSSDSVSQVNQLNVIDPGP